MAGQEDKVLSSNWGSLNRHLLATIYPVDRKGARIKDSLAVKAPVLDGATLEMTLNWQSPFENAGTESTMPTLFAALQSGATQPFIDLLGGDKGGNTGSKAANLLQKFEGRTGITKLNSTQIFVGMQPLKFSVTLLFRAWKDPYAEVQQPTDQLMAWTLPKELAADGVLAKVIEEAKNKGATDWIEAILPSQAPTLLAFGYKGRTYFPLVVESVSVPITNPITRDGAETETQITLSISSLQAIDATDWKNFRYNGGY